MRKRNPACYVWFLTSLLRLLRGGIRKALCEGHSCSGSAQLPHLGAQAELRGPVREAAEGLLPWEKTDCPLELSKEEEELMGGAWGTAMGTHDPEGQGGMAKTKKILRISETSRPLRPPKPGSEWPL